ncbi:Asp-tRNA(Asn)/Glu-tRNA(Gln) amidotransferase subunit GatC [Desulfovibrio sp. OttesenSCG-928-M16]|nr:Asp-tRNA(Asn)/Glu-tRNA(Gln) amidotransferase subunit GatC [Desulfovibrio sp. OttesenSCG-928-M16]
MPVSKEQVLATAHLCRLDLSLAASGGESPEERLERFATQMNSIIGYMDILAQVDTDDVEPLYSPLGQPEPPRADIAEQRLTVEDILANAPKRKQNFFVVPPVI